MRRAGFAIREDDLSGNDVRALLTFHYADMHRHSPQDSCHVLDLAKLIVPEMSVWSLWSDDRLAGVGAPKALGDGVGELKSMRTHPDYLRRGVAEALLDHILAQGRVRGYRRLSLETGSGPAFEPALALYRRRGFVPGDAFADYKPGAFTRFLHFDL